jgi:energy-coupling factor transport system ATP-binding protein
VTHDVELVAAVAERVVVLDEGVVIDDGPAHTVLRRHAELTPQVAQLFPQQPWLTSSDALAAQMGPPRPGSQ